MSNKADLQNRASFLVSQHGGIRAASRATGIPYSTFRRLVKNRNHQATKSVRKKMNTQFRRLAPTDVKRREKRINPKTDKKFGAGFALSNEQDARRFERSLRQQGIRVKVIGRFDWVDNTGNAQTTWATASSVEGAKTMLIDKINRAGDSASAMEQTPKSEYVYRVIPQVN